MELRSYLSNIILLMGYYDVVFRVILMCWATYTFILGQ